MRQADGWWWPDHERHLIDWMADPKNRMKLHGRSMYQGKKQMLFLDHCPLDRRRTLIDIGSHIGLWSFTLAHYFKRIEAFEPVEAHRECFVKNVIEAPNRDFTCEVNLRPYALGDRAGKVAIKVDPYSTGGSFVQDKGDVEMRTLDSFAFTEVDAMKIDCEGYEEFVLRGAEELIVTWRPSIIVEQKRDFPVKFGLQPMGAVKYLIGLGYKTVGEISGDYVMVPA